MKIKEYLLEKNPPAGVPQHSRLWNIASEGKEYDQSDIENFIRDHLSGTKRKTTKDLMWNFVKKEKMFKAKKNDFEDVWSGLVDDKYLIPIEKSNQYKWEK